MTTQTDTRLVERIIHDSQGDPLLLAARIYELQVDAVNLADEYEDVPAADLPEGFSEFLSACRSLAEMEVRL